VTFEAKKLPLPLWIPQKNRVATAYLSSANGNLSRQNKAELGMQGGLAWYALGLTSAWYALGLKITQGDKLKQIGRGVKWM